MGRFTKRAPDPPDERTVGNPRGSRSMRCRLVTGWWLPGVTGVVAVGVGTAAAGSGDLHWWLLWTGGLALVCGAGAVAASLAFHGGRASSRAERAAWTALGVALTLGAFVTLWTATSSESPSPSFMTIIWILVPIGLMSLLILMTAAIAGRTNTMNRELAYFLTFAALLFATASYCTTVNLPVRVRATTNEPAMTTQAADLVRHRDWYGSPLPSGQIEPGQLPPERVPERIGDFRVSAVELDDFDLAGCIAPPGNGGLRFHIGGPDSQTQLIYCPLREPDPSTIHDSVQQLSGPWYLDSTD